MFIINIIIVFYNGPMYIYWPGLPSYTYILYYTIRMARRAEMIDDNRGAAVAYIITVKDWIRYTT